MELRHLRYFRTLAGQLNFTRAAECLYITQSTLSHQIKQLEDEIGLPLFERKGKGIALTHAGQWPRARTTDPCVWLQNTR